MTTATLELERPQFDRSDISDYYRLMAEEISDPNADALDAICSRCYAPMSWAQWINGNDFKRETSCHSCGKRILSTGSYEWPMPVQQQDLAASPGYFNRRWYHATRRQNWAEVAREAAAGRLLVHAGSKLSALSRADLFLRERFNPNPQPIQLYSFELRSTAEFSTTIYDDMGEDWPERLGDGLSMRVCSTTSTDEDEPSRWEPMGEGVLGIPYYNRYEVPGEISILFSAPLIDLDSVEVEELVRPSAQSGWDR